LRLTGGILCVHSALGDPLVRLHSRAQFAEEAQVLLGFDTELRVCCTGHTHAPQLVEVGPSGVVRRAPGPGLGLDPEAFCFINPGSVGQPRDGDERAAYALFDREAGRVSFHRVAYDVRRITRDNARRGIKISPRTGVTGSWMTRMVDSVG
jgi:predicted phosphodiesterase